MKLYEVERKDVDPSFHDLVTDARKAAQAGLTDGVTATVHECSMARITGERLAELLTAAVAGARLQWDRRVPVRRYIGQPGDGPELGAEEQGHGEDEA